jgi:DNA excision repair protein ERCC-4
LLFVPEAFMEGSDPRPIRILADDRERGSAVLAALQAMEGIDVQIQRLEAGDYCIEDSLLVERKGLPDLLASIEDGRLFRQAKALALSGKRCLVLLEGGLESIQHRAMRREAIQGALLNLVLVWGIPVLRALDGQEAARLMVQAARQLRRACHPSAHRPGRCPDALQTAQTYVLQGLPGVGQRLALRLLEHFGTVEAVMTASVDQLRTVPGIGMRKAARIRWVLEGRAGSHARP